jgi:error-prone DNA polymerase
VLTATDLRHQPHGARVRVAGVVTHRQRPATAQGITFVNLEDETGLINVVVHKGCWARHRRVAQEAPAMLVKGRLERGDGDVLNVVAERLEPFPVELAEPEPPDPLVPQQAGGSASTDTTTPGPGRLNLRSRDFR